MNTITFEGFDRLNLKEFGERLFRFIQTEKIFVNESFVLSLEGKFGTGKTTFISMWVNWIEELGKAEEVPVVVRLNAWESDIGEDPVLAIVSDLSKAIEKFQEKVEQSIIDDIKSKAGQVGKMAFSLANDFVAHSIGIDVVKAGEYAERSKTVDEIGLTVFKIFEARKNALIELRQLIRKVVGDHELRFLLVVDELDRCRPSYAIQYLEALKHLFNEKGLAVVLAVDRSQLAASAKSAFGSELDFNEYYRKFAHRRVEIPTRTPRAVAGFVEALVEKFLKSDELAKLSRFSIVGMGAGDQDDMAAGLRAFGLTLRQSEEACRVMAHLLVLNRQEIQMSSAWFSALVFMACLMVSNEVLYRKIGKLEISPLELATFVKGLAFSLEDSHANKWWQLNILVAFQEGENRAAIISAIANPGDDQESVEREFAQSWRNFGNRHGKSPLRSIYDKIESLERFIKS